MYVYVHVYMCGTLYSIVFKINYKYYVYLRVTCMYNYKVIMAVFFFLEYVLHMYTSDHGYLVLHTSIHISNCLKNVYVCSSVFITSLPVN